MVALASQISAAVRAGVGQAEQRDGRGDHLVDVVEVAVGEVEQRQVEQLAALSLEEQVVDQRRRLDAATAGLGGDRLGGVDVVVDRVAHLEQDVESAGDLLEQAVGQLAHQRVRARRARAPCGRDRREPPLAPRGAGRRARRTPDTAGTGWRWPRARAVRRSGGERPDLSHPVLRRASCRCDRTGASIGRVSGRPVAR